MKPDITLSDGEWKLMNLLWEESPKTISQMVAALQEETGWNKNTVYVMLTRLEDKGAVRYEDGSRARLYFPLIEKTDLALKETENFLKKVYDGSLGLMVASMAGQKALRQEDIQALYDLLQSAREEGDT